MNKLENNPPFSYKTTGQIIENLNELTPKYSEVTVSSAQLKTIGSTPYQLLGTPGANNYYDILKIIVEFNYASPTYTLTDPQLFIGTTDNNYAGFWMAKNLITSTQKGIVIANGYSPTSVEGQYPVYANEILNQAIYLTTSLGGNPATGNGTLKIKMWYNIRTIG